MIPSQIAHYRITRPLGEGGMGVVYEAHDERLERRVALKLIREAVKSEPMRLRFWREARAAARVSHPNVCQIYEVGEEGDALYIVMELLTGEPLQARIARAPLPVNEGLQIGSQILSALDVLHAQGIVHRDLKPSNVFLSPHGVKLLDFGLAKMRRGSTHADLDLTQPGMAVGSPRYMAPEVWAGRDAGPQSDLFSLGAILYEMLTGSPAFPGKTLEEVCHAVVNERPATLTGDAGTMAVDRVIQVSLAKSVEQRYPSAEAMLREVTALQSGIDTTTPVQPRKLTRVVVLPFRALKPDTETDFLSFSLPDAISASLSGFDSLVVCSSATAARFASDNPDLKQIVTETGANAVLTGSLLRAGDQVRVTTQLVNVPDGTIACSRTAQVALGDLFQLQDSLAREIVDSLSIPLTGKSGEALQTDVPATPAAYELYLRANQLSTNRRLLTNARSLYRSTLDLDPHYAPAWAQLARVYRVLAKYEQEGDAEQSRTLASENLKLAEQAFQRALELNPDSSLTHNLYTYFEVEEQGRARESMLRLLERVRVRPNDPLTFAGLVVTCRFCGLLDASVGADKRARQLDPAIRTSVHYTYWMLGDYETAIRYDDEDMRFIQLYAMPVIEDQGNAAKALREHAWSTLPGLEREVFQAVHSALDQDRDACKRAANRILESHFHDPEGLFFVARSLAHVGELDLAAATIERVVRGAFSCHETMQWDPWLAPLRGREDFEASLEQARRQHKEAAAAFRAAGGERILGVSVAKS